MSMLMRFMTGAITVALSAQGFGIDRGELRVAVDQLWDSSIALTQTIEGGNGGGSGHTLPALSRGEEDLLVAARKFVDVTGKLFKTINSGSESQIKRDLNSLSLSFKNLEKTYQENKQQLKSRTKSAYSIVKRDYGIVVQLGNRSGGGGGSSHNL